MITLKSLSSDLLNLACHTRDNCILRRVKKQNPDITLVTVGEQEIEQRSLNNEQSNIFANLQELRSQASGLEDEMEALNEMLSSGAVAGGMGDTGGQSAVRGMVMAEQQLNILDDNAKDRKTIKQGFRAEIATDFLKPLRDLVEQTDTVIQALSKGMMSSCGAEWEAAIQRESDKILNIHKKAGVSTRYLVPVSMFSF